jgi:hypothetical protein
MALGFIAIGLTAGLEANWWGWLFLLLVAWPVWRISRIRRRHASDPTHGREA